MNADHKMKTTPLSVITNLISDSALQVERITGSVLAKSNLANEIAGLLHTTTALRAKLAGLASDEQDCLKMLDDLRANRLGHMIEFQSLSEEAMTRLRRRLSTRLTTHLAAVRRNKTTLERGMELARAGMLNRFATFAVAGLSQDPDSMMDKARAFVVAYLVAARLKDHLETAGFRWAGEKTLISLYLNAIGCERRQSKERFVADPISSIIATAIGFVSAMRLHQCFYQLHQTLIGEKSMQELEFLDFPKHTSIAFERGYYRASTPEEEFHRLMHRTRTAPTA
ncbi:MAG: hypothetical protein V4695_00370 [Pseudomonadota bacterium]